MSLNFTAFIWFSLMEDRVLVEVIKFLRGQIRWVKKLKFVFKGPIVTLDSLQFFNKVEALHLNEGCL